LASIEQSTDQGRAIIYIHGRGFKPPTEVVQTLWTNALRRGLSRDFKKNGPVSKFNKATVDSAYYGDLSNDVRGAAGKSYDEVLDAADLENALATLVALESAKKFRRSGYERLPGHNSIKEFLADIGAPVLSTLGLTDIALSRSMPEVSAYWDATGAFCRESRERLLTPLRAALARGDKILLISHCLGSVIAYDCLWKLSHEAQSPLGKVDTWLTLGSPLGDEFVKRKLAGADQQGDERFPNNIVNWYNFAAEDDFTCHDETVANDFRPMLNSRLISRIKDFRIYNLAVRYGRSNPHTSVGYLTHPRVAKLLAEWL
jgi:hypothetical protein